MAKKRTSYCADFETTSYKQNKDKTRVWAYGVCEIGSEDSTFIYGNNIDDFMLWCETTYNPIVYFHNLKFDGGFIIDWLFRNGYRYSKTKVDKTFSCVISDSNMFYQIEVVFYVRKSVKRVVTFYDSLKKLPFSADRIAKAWKLKEQKLEIDYDEIREENHILTPQEIIYLKHDIVIISKALKTQFDENLTKMTVGSDAFNYYKDSIGKDLFNNWFPKLSLQMYQDMKQGYRGGQTFLINSRAMITYNGMVSFDVNSMYPWAMKECLLPYGEPLWFNGEYKYDEFYPLYMIMCTIDVSVKENHIPTIQIKGGRFIDTEYLEDTNGSVDVVLTSVDIENIYEQYNVHQFDVHGGYKFQGRKGMFDDYIDHWMYVKANNEGAMRELAKLMLNSLYGKFGKNPDVTGKIPRFDKETDRVKYEMDDLNMSEPEYIPLAAFVTSYARQRIVQSAQKVYDRFVYMDTDSLYLIGKETPKELEDIIHESKLGYWKKEHTIERGYFIRQKTYIIEYYEYDENGNKELVLDIKGSGMSAKVKEQVKNFEDFKIGFKSDVGLKHKVVSGGVVLAPSDFEIKGSKKGLDMIERVNSVDKEFII